MPNIRRFAFALMVLAPTCCWAASNEWLTDLDAAKAEAQRLDRPILVHFYMKLCAPCRRMDKNVLNTPQVLEQISANVVAVKICIEEHPELANRFDVDHFPTDVFVEPNGKKISVSTGERTLDEYLTSISRASTRYADLVAERTPAASPAETEVAASNPEGPAAQPVANSVMLRGYCPVTLWNRRKWEKGSPQFAAEYKGQTYWMVSASDRRSFEDNPGRYAPQLLGCDPVVIATDDRAVPGSTRYGAFYDDELFLFTSDANRKQFKSNPDHFIRDKVVLDVDQIETVTR